MSTNTPLFQEIKIGPLTASNRIALNAMECNDADNHGNPTDLTYERYKKAFRGGAGLVLMEAISVVDESRGRLNQLIGTPENQPALTELINTLRKENDKTILLIQLTHSGELSHSDFSRKVCVKPLPGYGGDLLTEEEVEEIIDKFVISAKVAYDAGADGVDVKLCHGYLGSQFCRPYNDRKWKYGGPFENRMRFAYEIYERIDKEINDPNFLVGSKISVWEGFPGGMGTAGPDTPVLDFEEIQKMCQGLEERGASYIIQSAGSPSITLALTQPEKSMPDYGYLHFTFQKVVRDALKPETVVIGSAYSIYSDGRIKFLATEKEKTTFEYWANKNISDGYVDMVALGRQSLADSELPIKMLEGRADEINWCSLCDNCLEFLIRQRPVACATYNKDYAKALVEMRREEGKLREKRT
ncbi:MAG: NADH:flavin oxidoreductase [Anaerolineales bacterium]|nr:NADH:flavin oxidoreductase [Anaerolineales bacterium]